MYSVSPSVHQIVLWENTRSFTAEDLVQAGSLPRSVLDAARRTLAGRRDILVAGGTGSGKTTMLNALIELLDPAERIVSIEDTLELRIHQPNAVRFEARELGKSATTVRDLVKHSLRHRPDHIVVGEIRGAEAADLLQALNTSHGGSLTTIHANNATSALDRLASCAMQARDLPQHRERHLPSPPHEPDRRPAGYRGSALPDGLGERRQHLAHQPRIPPR